MLQVCSGKGHAKKQTQIGLQENTKMKKIITIALIAIASLTAAFAADASVTVNGNVPETAFAYKLNYDGAAVTADQQIYQSGTTRWNLTEAGNTKDFTVTFTGNQAEDHTAKLSVSAGAFTDKVSGHSTQAVLVDDKATAAKEAEASLSDLSYAIEAKRYATDTTAFTFFLYWAGDKTMDAGDYTSDVTITYSID
jgi:hypothetical protein